MTPEKAHKVAQPAEPHSGERRGRRSAPLNSDHEAIMSAYAAHLGQSQLRGHSSRTYLSAVRGYFRWLESADITGDSLTDSRARDRAVRGYVAWLATADKRTPATLNKAMTVLDDFYQWRGMGKCEVDRVRPALHEPFALDREAVLRYLQAADRCGSPRDRAIALVPYYTGARISEISALDIADFAVGPAADTEGAISAFGDHARGVVRLTDGSGRQRMVPAHSALWRALSAWLTEHPSRFDADSPLFLSRQHRRMTPDALNDVVARIAQAAELEGRVTANVWRSTFREHIILNGASSAAVAHLMGLRRIVHTGSPRFHSDVHGAISSLLTHTQPGLSLGGTQSDPGARADVRQTQLRVINQMAMGDPAVADWQRDLAITLRKKGDEAFAAGDLAAARSAYQESLDISTQPILTDAPNADWQRETAIVHVKLGNVAANIAYEELRIAQDAYQAGMRISPQLGDAGNTGWQQDLRVMIQRINDLVARST